MRIASIIILSTILGLAMMVNPPADPLVPMAELGKEIFFDKISSPDWMSCANCHGPEVGFTGPIPGINKHGAVYRGAVPQRFGNRKPPSASYATFSPVFYYDEVEELFIGGNFWDGRATGELLGHPSADQALGPFLNPVEQNNPSKQAVLEQIADGQYAGLWEIVWGEPISFDTPAEIEMNYNRVGLAIAAYEESDELNAFSSKWDYFLDGEVQFNEQEINGMALFFGEALCSQCHAPPLFTDFTYDNLGVPINPENPFYEMDQVFLDDGSPINPLGANWIDKGLGGFLETRPEWADKAAENMGKHKVPTLRNVDKRPGKNFPKAYMHNGVFKSLKEVVHFYNTRDVEDWPDPEVPENVNTSELGDLGLTDAEEDDLVAFMATLSDGYKLSNKTGEGLETSSQKIGLEVWPNPSNELTNIRYYLPEDAFTLIEVYDMTGKLMETIFTGQREKGQYQVEFPVSDYVGGVFFIRIKAGDFAMSHKISVVK